MIKIQRRAAIVGAEKIAGAEKISSAAAAMPPPCGSGYSRGTNLRPCMPSMDYLGGSHSGSSLYELSERSKVLHHHLDREWSGCDAYPCFRMRTLMDVPNLKAQLCQLPLETILCHDLAPLKNDLGGC